MRIIDLRVEQGKELESFNNNNKKHNELTDGFFMSLSCSGFNTRNNNKELIKSLRDTIKRQRKVYNAAKLDNNKSGTNGCYNVNPTLIVVQNYGYGVYGIAEVLKRD